METLEKLIDERVEKALAELRESPEFLSQLTAQSDTLEALLSRISDEETRKAVMTFEGQKNALSSIQLKAIYKAGALDAVKLLKTLGVI